MRSENSVTVTSKEELKQYLECELPKYGVCGGKYFLQIGENAILRKHQYILRNYEYCLNTGKRFSMLLWKYRLSRIQNKYSLHIPANTCGKGLRIMHVGPILLNGHARLGENCALHINTSIVAGGTSNDAPFLDDGVVVGVGAVVLGGVKIGKNIAIGANSVVNKSFLEDNIAIAGVPAKKVSNNGRLSWNRGTQKTQE